jgi:hypothetical protein
MTAIPLAVLVLFGVIVAGGPHAFFRTMERSLERMVQWVSDMAS